MKKNLFVLLCLSFLASCASGPQKSMDTSKNAKRSLDSIESQSQPIRTRTLEPFWENRSRDLR